MRRLRPVQLQEAIKPKDKIVLANALADVLFDLKLIAPVFTKIKPVLMKDLVGLEFPDAKVKLTGAQAAKLATVFESIMKGKDAKAALSALAKAVVEIAAPDSGF